MLPETKAILFNLFRDYLATSEQKQKIIKMQNEERAKNELKKQQKYETDIFKNKKVEQQTNAIQEEKSLIKYKENIFQKIINKIKNWFKKQTNSPFMGESFCISLEKILEKLYNVVHREGKMLNMEKYLDLENKIKTAQ